MKNRLIEKGRDIDALKLRHQVTTKPKPSPVVKAYIASFPGAGFNFMHRRHSAGVMIKQFSALVADGQQSYSDKPCLVQQFTDVGVALNKHIVKALLGFNRQWFGQKPDKHQPNWQNFKLAFAPLGDLKDSKICWFMPRLMPLLKICCRVWPWKIHAGFMIKSWWLPSISCLWRWMNLTKPKPWCFANFLSVGQSVLAQLKSVYEQWQQVHKTATTWPWYFEDPYRRYRDTSSMIWVCRTLCIAWVIKISAISALFAGVIWCVLPVGWSTNLDADLDAVYRAR